MKAFCYEEGSENVINLLNSDIPAYSSVVAYAEILFALNCFETEEKS
ncbi:MAG: hypothetical protein ABIN15_01970 [candidate division WOR-3 bacterium]